MAHSFCMMISPAGHFEETGEARSCEPHVLVTSIDFRPPRPDVEAFLYGPWSGAISKTGADIIPLVWCESFWKVDLLAAPMGKPDEVIFLVALIEHVNGNPSSVRVLAKKAVIEALNTSAGEAEETRCKNGPCDR